MTARRGKLISRFIWRLGRVLFALAARGEADEKGQQYSGDKSWFHFSDIVPLRPVGAVVGAGGKSQAGHGDLEELFAFR